MKLEDQLLERSGSSCELCGDTTGIKVYEVKPDAMSTPENTLLTCEKCTNQINKTEETDPKHWTCLSTSMWSEIPAVQVIAWRMLNRLQNESWAADNLDILYLDDATLEWAKESGDHNQSASEEIHKDSNGLVLKEGDTVVLTRSLDVKGSQINAKMGTVVKNIRLVDGNPEQIEGKIDGQVIVILTKYLRKQG
ncbi:MAG: PhnA protein [Pedobacter sp.]|nr:MAG: PhnA protein [Pedobacter sp.]